MSYLLNLPLEAIAVAAGFDKETLLVETLVPPPGLCGCMLSV